MGIVIDIAKFVLNAMYCILKLFPVKNKVLFLSRQSNSISIDFSLLIDEINSNNKKGNKKNIDIVVLTKRIDKGIFNKLKYAGHIFRQMYHLATAKVVVIDGYQIAVSVLKHKKSLVVIQIWHALGSLKKFGYSIKDKKEGSKETIIDKMNMHKNYTWILSSSKVSARAFEQAFNVSRSVIKIMSLPRVDFLLSEKYKNQTQEKIYKSYPELKNDKLNILYVPTFRKNAEVNTKEIIDNLEYSKYNLIVKLHHGLEEVYINGKDNPVINNVATGMEFLHVADAVITDYSAITYEAALMNKPIYFYVYDFEKYTTNRDFYLDYKNEMPGFISKDAKEILEAINKGVFYEQKGQKFVKRYIENTSNCTRKIVDLIVENIEKQ